MILGSDLPSLSGYPFDVRYSPGAEARARASADVAADAYRYLGRLFSLETLDLALIVAGRDEWVSAAPYGLPYFNDDEDQIRPGIIVMPASRGDFWVGMGEDLRETTPEEYPRLLDAYPDGAGGLDLQRFFDLITIHELGHAYETLGRLHLPRFWLSEIFANLALHAFVATVRPDDVALLETLSLVGAASTGLDERMRREGFTSLPDLETHYTGGDRPMDALNYIWYQYRWQRIAANAFNAEGETVLRRFWDYFRTADPGDPGFATDASLASRLREHVSETLGEAIARWDDDVA